MNQIIYVPNSGSPIKNLKTSTSTQVQLWQEFSLIKFLPDEEVENRNISAWIEQAKIYFQDGFTSNWRSAGLLYYYSFLNLSKAFLAQKAKIGFEELRSISVYHGISANPQSPEQIIDYEVEIHKTVHKQKKNIFANFYEEFTKKEWPFNENVTVRVFDLIGYCDEISHEVETFYSISKKAIACKSLTRNDDSFIWIETLVINERAAEMFDELKELSPLLIAFSDMTANDLAAWKELHDLTPQQLYQCSSIRHSSREIIPDKINQQAEEITNEFVSLFSFRIIQFPNFDIYEEKTWLLTKKLSINGQELDWHPLLSDYIISFVLSTILRYHPHLFVNDDKNSFIAEAWINQSSINTLRYFLMSFTNPSVRLN